MSLPKFPQTAATERLGIHAIAAIFAKMGYIFRETSTSDTGIDGYVEEVNEANEATGRLLALQIKSGTSYFNDSGNHFVFYANDSHMKYWRLYPIPVVLCIHNPETDHIYFQSIQRHCHDDSTKIVIPKTQILSPDNKDDLLKHIAGASTAYHTTQELYDIMKDRRIATGQSYVSFMDLFIGGLTNLCTDLFCDISVLTNLIDLRGTLPTVSLGGSETNFLWEFIKFISIENLAVVNFDACLYDWEERMQCPQILVSLTYRGIQYRDYVENKHPGTVYDSPVSLQIDNSWDLKMKKLLIR